MEHVCQHNRFTKKNITLDSMRAYILHIVYSSITNKTLLERTSDLYPFSHRPNPAIRVSSQIAGGPYLTRPTSSLTNRLKANFCTQKAIQPDHRR